MTSHEQQCKSGRISPFVLWLTGLSGSGKSTIAEELVRELRKRNLDVEQLDGDKVRAILGNSGFSREQRNQHIRYIGLLASRLEAHGIPVVASFISPYAESRDFVRKLCQTFIEVHVSAPLSVCMERDVKGLYAASKHGKVNRMTGVADPYEPPVHPEITLDTSLLSKEEAISKILEYLGFSSRE